MNFTGRDRAVVEALGLSAPDLRALADVLESQHRTVLVGELVQAQVAALPRHHRYMASLQRLATWAANRDANAVVADDIVRWARCAGEEARADRKARHGVTAEEMFVLAARAAYKRAMESGAVLVNPAAEVPLPERPSSRRTALTCDQLRQMHLGLVAHSRDPELDDLVFQFLRETAGRRMGAMWLTYSDLAPATRAVRLNEKYGKQRWVPVSAHLMQRLVAHHEDRHPHCERVLHRADGRHLNDKWFEGFGQRVQKLPWAAELGVSAHWLRHTTLTDIERIAGMRVAAALAGHDDRSLGVTGIYTRPSAHELEDAHTRLFFDRPVESTQATARPHLFRRVLPTTVSVSYELPSS